MRWTRQRFSERGTVVLETALSLLPLLVVLFGIMEGARFLSVQHNLSNAAREGARLSVAPLSRTSILASEAEIRDRVTTFLAASAIHGATITVERPVLIDTGGVQTEFTRVRVELTYRPLSLAMFRVLAIPLSGQALMRNETSP